MKEIKNLEEHTRRDTLEESLDPNYRRSSFDPNISNQPCTILSHDAEDFLSLEVEDYLDSISYWESSASE